jgi:SAM-dependent methyltransferase
MGIPDLCGPNDALSPDEAALVDQLCALYPTATFDELVLARLSARFAAANLTREERRQQFTHYSLTMRKRGQQFHQMFRNRLAEHFSAPRLGLALDVGCGTGAGLAPLVADFEHVVGLDISMSALIIAKKLIESEGWTHVTLVRGSALHLPVSDSIIDYATAINVLEHVFAPAQMLTEVHRVLASGGLFVGDSRNRFDLFFPEPHVGLRWVGFLPRRWMAPYVRWRRGVSYHHTHLLSYGDLRDGLRTAFGPEWRILLPGVSAYGASARAERLLERVSRMGFVRRALTRLSPTYLALARRVI